MIPLTYYAELVRKNYKVNLYEIAKNIKNTKVKLIINENTSKEIVTECYTNNYIRPECKNLQIKSILTLDYDYYYIPIITVTEIW